MLDSIHQEEEDKYNYQQKSVTQCCVGKCRCICWRRDCRWGWRCTVERLSEALLEINRNGIFSLLVERIS
jgi:hypothetical protein